MFNTIKLRHKFDREINIFAETRITISIINHLIKGYEKDVSMALKNVLFRLIECKTFINNKNTVLQHLFGFF